MPAQVFQRCPNCETAIDVSIYVVGQSIRCAKCGIRFPVAPRGGTAIVPAAAPAAPVAPIAPVAMIPEGASAQTVITGPPILPGYEVHEVLGRGGMGTVFKCRQLSLGRTVAVKVLAPALADDPAFVARFEKESAALAAIQHPNIVSIIDRGQHGKTCFFAMEYVEGGSVRQLLEKGPLDPDRALRLFTTVCNAVAAAHQKGVIHRDLKPENVLLAVDGTPKVADFGLAGMESVPGLTRPAMAMGTAQYMAPEQGRDARSVDSRADVYSLGVVLYEMLVGEVPVGRFLPPSERRPGIDPRIDSVVLRMLDPDPDRRYGDLRAVAHELGELIGTSPGRGPGVTPVDRRAVERAVRSRRRARPMALVVAAIVLVALAVGVAVGVSLSGPPPSAISKP